MDSNNKNHKYNTIINDIDHVLCIEIDKVITAEGYKENFLPKLNEMINKHGEARLLINYKNFQGWEKAAAQMDLETAANNVKTIKKMALINAPEKEAFQRNLKKEIMAGELALFNDSEYSKALEWVSG